MRRILVTGAGGSAAANFIKCLRMSPEEFYVVGTDINKEHIELSDVDKRFMIPVSSSKNYLPILQKLVRNERAEVIHPQPDPEVLVLSKNRKLFGSKIFLPSDKTIAACHDKLFTNLELKRHSVPTPTSYRATKQTLYTHIKSLMAEGGSRKVWVRATKGAGSKASIPVSNPKEAKDWIEYWRFHKNLGYDDFMLCEYLPGQDFAWQSLWKDGELVVSQARKRIMYLYGFLSPSGTSSTPSVAVTVHREDVNEVATKAVRAIDDRASGIFCVDLKENADGVPCVTEINAGRFFTTSNFIAEAGCNMPYYYVKMALREKLPALPKYNAVPAGLYWVRMVDMGHRLIREGEWRSKVLT